MRLHQEHDDPRRETCTPCDVDMTIAANDKELLAAVLARRLEAMSEPVVVLTITCGGCGRRLEVHCARPTVFGMMRPYAFDCPGVGCGRRLEKALAGDIIDVVVVG